MRIVLPLAVLILVIAALESIQFVRMGWFSKTPLVTASVQDRTFTVHPGAIRLVDAMGLGGKDLDYVAISIPDGGTIFKQYVDAPAPQVDLQILRFADGCKAQGRRLVYPHYRGRTILLDCTKLLKSPLFVADGRRSKIRAQFTHGSDLDVSMYSNGQLIDQMQTVEMPIGLHGVEIDFERAARTLRQTDRVVLSFRGTKQGQYGVIGYTETLNFTAGEEFTVSNYTPRITGEHHPEVLEMLQSKLRSLASQIITFVAENRRGGAPEVTATLLWEEATAALETGLQSSERVEIVLASTREQVAELFHLDEFERAIVENQQSSLSPMQLDFVFEEIEKALVDKHHELGNCHLFWSGENQDTWEQLDAQEFGDHTGYKPPYVTFSGQLGMGSLSRKQQCIVLLHSRILFAELFQDSLARIPD